MAEGTTDARDRARAGATARRQILVGHANTWHDPAFALADGERLFAEGVERHAQCKRSR